MTNDAELASLIRRMAVSMADDAELVAAVKDATTEHRTRPHDLKDFREQAEAAELDQLAHQLAESVEVAATWLPMLMVEAQVLRDRLDQLNRVRGERIIDGKRFRPVKHGGEGTPDR